MGLATYIQGYRKIEDCISGKIESIGWYEVNINKISKHRIENSFMVYHEELHAIKQILESGISHEIGFYELGPLTFYFNIMNSVSGYGYLKRNEELYGIMFEATKILKVISSVLEVVGHIGLSQEYIESDRKILEQLIEVLSTISDNNGIVEFSIS